MWGLLKSSNKEEGDDKPPTSTAPPPMMFNPQSTNSGIKPQTSRNPLSKQKRPTGAGLAMNQVQLQNQPLSPTGQPLSPTSAAPSQPDGPLSPSAKPVYNAFPNFNTNDATASTTQESTTKDSDLQNQYLNNCDYDTATTEQSYKCNNNGEHSGNNQLFEVNSHIQEEIPDSSHYQNSTNEQTQPDYISHAAQSPPSDITGDLAHHESEPQKQPQPEEHQTDEQVIYETEEQYNYVYFGYYGSNPPAGEWIAYQEQWAAYRKSLTQEQPEGTYVQEDAPEQQHHYDNQDSSVPEYNVNSNTQQESTDHDPLAARNRNHSSTSGGIYDPLTEINKLTSHSSRERYDSQASKEHVIPHFSLIDEQNNQKTQNLDSTSNYNSSKKDFEVKPDAFQGFENQSNDTNLFYDNFYTGTQQQIPSTSASVFDQAILQTEHQTTPQSYFNSNDQFPPPQNNSNKEPNHAEAQGSLMANPDNQYQKERDSTTPLWEKKDLNLAQCDGSVEPTHQSPLSPRSDSSQRQERKNSTSNSMSSNHRRDRHDTIGNSSSWSQASTSTATGDGQLQLTADRERYSSSASQNINPRSRNASSASNKDDSLNNVLPPPQFSEYSSGVVPPPQNFTNHQNQYIDRHCQDPESHDIQQSNVEQTIEPRFRLGGSTSEDSLSNLHNWNIPVHNEQLSHGRGEVPIRQYSHPPTHQLPQMPLSQDLLNQSYAKSLQAPGLRQPSLPGSQTTQQNLREPNLLKQQSLELPQQHSQEFDKPPTNSQQFPQEPPEQNLQEFNHPPKKVQQSTQEQPQQHFQELSQPPTTSQEFPHEPPQKHLQEFNEPLKKVQQCPQEPPQQHLQEFDQPPNNSQQFPQATRQHSLLGPRRSLQQPMQTPQQIHSFPRPAETLQMPRMLHQQPSQQIQNNSSYESQLQKPLQPHIITPLAKDIQVNHHIASLDHSLQAPNLSQLPSKNDAQFSQGYTFSNEPKRNDNNECHTSSFGGPLLDTDGSDAHPPHSNFNPPNIASSMSMPHSNNQSVEHKIPDGVLMPPPAQGSYERINLKNNRRSPHINYAPQSSIDYNNITFARPIGQVDSRPSSRGSDDTIARLRKEYEERKIMKRTTPDSLGSLSGEPLGSPLLNSTTNAGSKKLGSMSMKSLRNMSQSTASLIAAQEAYENVVLKTEPQTYENHELVSAKKPPLPPKPGVPPRTTLRDTRRQNARPTNYGHRRTGSAGSVTSLQSESKSHSRMDRSLQESSRIRHEVSKSRDEMSMSRDEMSRSRNEVSRDEQYDERSRRDGRQDPRYDYDRSRYERYRREEVYRREELMRRSELERKGAHPEDYYKDYRERYQRNYPGYMHDYNRSRSHYSDSRGDPSEEVSITHSESNRSDPASIGETNCRSKRAGWSSPGWGYPPSSPPPSSPPPSSQHPHPSSPHPPPFSQHFTSQQSMLSRLYNGPPPLYMRSHNTPRARSLDRKRSPGSRSISPLARDERPLFTKSNSPLARDERPLYTRLNSPLARDERPLYGRSISPQSPGSRSPCDFIKHHSTLFSGKTSPSHCMINVGYSQLQDWLIAHKQFPLVETDAPDSLREGVETDAGVDISGVDGISSDVEEVGEITLSEEPEIEEESSAPLADLYTTPYLYTQCHVRAQCFAPNKFLCVVPNDDENEPHTVEISEFKLLYWQELKEIEDFPGPFIKGETPKRDVMSYCKKQANLLRKSNCADEGKILLWELLALLCKQNGVVIGTDVAELLLADQETSTVYSNSNISGYNVEGQLVEITETQKDDAINQIRECLFEGQRKEALEVSVKYYLWDLAFMISTTLSTDIMSDTMQRFSKSLHNDDSLKSFHQLIAGTEPSCCSQVSKWREHLAMILSNQSNKYDPNFNCVHTLASTLANEGMVHASHFASLMAGSKLTSVLDKSSPISLLGLDHTKEIHKLPYCAIQQTEIYEYAKSLGGETCIVTFQAVKLFYAREVAKVGLYSKSLQYLQQIANNINLAPKSYRARFIMRVYEECVRTLHLLHKQLPEWVDELRITLTNRNLGISNRSTAYSSRVATPDIQRVAQYLLHKQTATQQQSKLSQQQPEPQSQQQLPQQQSQPAQQQEQQQQLLTQQQQPIQEQQQLQFDQSSVSQEPSADNNNLSGAQSQHHNELLANGLAWDGQVYRHEMYPGWFYYEGEWYPDTTQQQQQDSQHETGLTYDPTRNVTHEAARDVTHEATRDVTHEAARDVTHEATRNVTHEATRDVAHKATRDMMAEMLCNGGGLTQDQPGFDAESVDNSTEIPSYKNNEQLHSQGYEQSNLQTYQSEHQETQISQSDENNLSEPNEQYSNNHENYSNYYDDVPKPINDVILPSDDVSGLYGDDTTIIKEKLSRQATLTNDEEVDRVREEGPPGPPPGGFTFFNPAQFSSGSAVLAPPVSTLPPSAEHILSDDEIKTPTNDPVEDLIDEDSLYSKKKPKPSDNEKPIESKEEKKPSSGLFSRLFNSSSAKKDKNMILPDDSKPTIYWDDKLGKYVDTTAGSDDEEEAPPPPPTSSLSASPPTMSLPASSRSSLSGASEDKIMSAPASPGSSSFRRKPGRSRLAANRYVDVMGGMKKSATTPSFS